MARTSCLFFNIVQYNPCCANTNDRVLDIAGGLPRRDIIGLIGTQKKSSGDLTEDYHMADEYWCIPFGYKSSVHVNKSCGVTLMLRRGRIKKQHVVRIFEVPKYLWGRCAAVIITVGLIKLAILLMYFPPRQRGAAARIKSEKTADTMCHWLKGILQQLRTCHQLFLLSDLNDGLRHDPEDGCCGTYETGRENHTAQQLKPILSGHGITSFGTHFKAPPSWIGETVQKTSDHIFG